jgi:hypothetical protein
LTAFAKEVVLASVGPLELVRRAVYVHDGELDGDEYLTVSQSVDVTNGAEGHCVACIVARE